MKKFLVVCLLLFILLGCAPAAADQSTQSTPVGQPGKGAGIPTQTRTPFQSVSATPTAKIALKTPTRTVIAATSTPAITATAAYPLAGRGPTNFAANVDPLTGLVVADPALLDRRPILIKVENLPRIHRPQWGVSLADLVFEYYTEQGTTRFSTVFYGQDSTMVGPIRSGRFFDTNVVQMYKSLFMFAGAYTDVINSFMKSNFANRLILETAGSCPALCRYDPSGQDLLMANTGEVKDYTRRIGMDNSRQNQDGMFFQMTAPSAGEAASQIFVRFSAAIYNRWDYDTETGKYLRFADADNAFNVQSETYTQLTDRLTDKPIAVDTLVMLCAPHKVYKRTSASEVIEIHLEPEYTASYVACDGKNYAGGSGPAFVARDGELYSVTWQRASETSVLTLVGADGKPFPFKPGQTWFEVLSQSSKVEKQDSGVWRFTHGMDF